VAPSSKVGLAAFDFASGTLLRPKPHAETSVLRVQRARSGVRPGGSNRWGNASRRSAALQKESHTLKRALTDPHLVSGIGNAYSDEILHRAKLSPFKLTRQLTSDEMGRLHSATLETLSEWTNALRSEAGEAFPEKVTAFHQGMAVHGRFGQPCPRCGTPVQRIVHGEHEVNYCPTCQTEGRLLADRALSKLLKDDWPKTLDEMERRRSRK
jgi:formamidopyrimidine-DNA glycosylase